MRTRVLLSTLLLVCFVFALWGVKTFYWHGCGPWIERNYRVSFRWDNGLKDLQILDSETGKPEADGKLRAIVSRESASIPSQLIDWTRLKRAHGQFYLSLQGCKQPFLVRWFDPDIPDLAEFMGAASSQDIQTVRESLAKGINVNAREFGTGRTALIWAAGDATKGLSSTILAKLTRPPDKDTLEFLLAAGADPNAKDVDGLTALMHADASQVRILLRYGTDVNAKDNEGRTALINSIYLGNVERARALVEAHADVNIADKHGWTALMYAASEDKAEQTRLLLAAGADPTAVNENNETALTIVRKKPKLTSEDRQVIDLLSKTRHSATPD